MIQEDDKLINMIQSSTRGLLASFRTKAAINYLIKGREKIADAAAKVTYKDLLDRIGAQKDRLAKLVNDFTKFNERYSLFSESKKDDDEDDHHSNDYNVGLIDIFKTNRKNILGQSILCFNEVSYYHDNSVDARLKFLDGINNNIWELKCDIRFLKTIINSRIR